MEKIITLRRATTLNDILCYDGELEGADYIFDANEQAAAGSDGSGQDSNENRQVLRTLVTEGAVSVPPGARFLAMHRTSDGVVNPIFSTLFPELAGDCRVTPCGDYLAILTADALRYALWSGEKYVMLGEAPAAPFANYLTVNRALPPYSYTDGEMPRLAVQSAIGDDSPKEVLDWLAGTADNCSESTRRAIADAVRIRMREFLDAVKAAGLFYGPVRLLTAWRLVDGRLWAPAARPATVADSLPGVTLGIVQAGVAGSTLHLSLQLSRAPFAVRTITSSTAAGSGWSHVVSGVETLTAPSGGDVNPDFISAPIWVDGSSRGFAVGQRAVADADYPAFPPLLGGMTERGVPSRLFGIGDRLVAVFNRGGDLPANVIVTSAVGIPAAAAGSGEVAGAPILHLTHSLRSLSSGQFGEFPLYAFSADGVRALTPAAGSFRDVQLLSRYVACGPDSFAPLPDATAFITTAGVMKIEGTSVTCLSKTLSRDFSAEDRLLYLYRENRLLLFRSGQPGIMACDPSTGKWEEVTGLLYGRHYAWPEAWVEREGRVGRAGLAEVTVAPALLAAFARNSVPIKTRPIKLGNAFMRKKIEEVEAIWPDGSREPLKVYGAMRLDRWFFLGLARAGRMMMRGSGWRFFRLETFAGFDGKVYYLPEIFIKFAAS